MKNKHKDYITLKNRLKRKIVFLVVVLSVTPLYAGKSYVDSLGKKSPYIWLLKKCNQEVFKKTFEYPFLELLSKDLKKEYNNLDSLKQKKEYIEFYWKEHKPNPFLAENEYLQNFINRYNYIKKHFSYPKPPYYDDRGKYYLKYGQPSYQFKENSQIKSAQLFRNERVRGFLGLVLFKMTALRIFIPIEYSVQGNETWVYHIISEDEEREIVLHFVAEGNFFREVESLDNAIIYPRKSELRYFYWADMMKERATATQSQSIFNTFEEICSFEEDLRVVANSGSVYSSFYDVTDPHHKLGQINTKLKVDLKRKKTLAPKILFTPKKAIQELLFNYDIVQFKGPQDTTILSINYFTSIAENFINGTKTNKLDTVSLQYGYLFENQMLKQVIKSTYEKSYSLQILYGLDLPYLIDNMKMSLLPRKGRISLQVKDEETQRRGFVKRTVLLRDFSTKELLISDIQFCQEVEDSLYKEFYPIIQKRGISVIPYPYESIKRSDQLFCYFEIYNIKTSGIQSQYEISIEVTTAKQKKGLFKKAVGIFSSSSENSISIHHTRVVEQDVTQELIGIDFSNLERGHYKLAIKVTDQEDQSISAEVTRDLQIME